MTDFVLSGTLKVDTEQGVVALEKAEAAVAKVGKAAASAAPSLETFDKEIVKAGSAADGAAGKLDRLSRSQGSASSGADDLHRKAGGVSGGLAQLAQKVLGAGDATDSLGGKAGALSKAMEAVGVDAGSMAASMGQPIAAAAIIAGSALAGYVAKLFEIEDGQRVAKDGTISFAREVDIALTGLKGVFASSAKSFEPIADGFDSLVQRMRDKLPEFNEVASAILGSIDRINRFGNENFGTIPSNLRGRYETYRKGKIETLRGEDMEDSLNANPVFGSGFVDRLAEFSQNRYKTMLADVALGTGAVANATRAYKAAEVDLERQVNAGIITLDAARKELERRRAAIDAAREATRNAAAADREATREAKANAKELEAIRIAASKGVASAVAIGAGASFSGLKEADDAARQASRVSSGVAAAVEGIESRLPQVGAKVADGFVDQALTQAVAVGQAIGGSAGRAMQTIAALALGSSTGNYTGLGGALGGALTLLSDPKGAGSGGGGAAFTAGLKGAISEPLAGLKDVFRGVFTSESGQAFAKLAGRAAGGAATGSAVAGIGNAIGIKLDRTGASVGGAVGSALGPAISKLGGALGMLGPFAGILGGIAGGLIGGLLAPKGSTTISATAGKISSSGTGNAAVQKATGAIGNTVTDALQSIAEQLGGEIGDFSVSIGKKKGQFRVDASGTGRLNGGTVTGTDSESEALTLAIADALKDGAIKSSPRVQAALLAYADNVNKAVTEALKVKSLEDLLAGQNNPFLAAFRTLESQLKQRMDVARQYGFDLAEIEKLNAKERAAALQDTLSRATGSIRSLLTDLTIGSGATGSATERLTGLTNERARLIGLANGGDTTQGDAIADITRKIDDLQRETFGSTAGFANGRADSISILSDLMRQTEDRAKAAQDQARGVAEGTLAKLGELNDTGDDQVALQAKMAATLASIDARLADGALFGGGGFGLAREYARLD